MKKHVIGEGSYGCVIQPALPCHTNKEKYINTTNKNVVSKIFKDDSKDYQSEKAIGHYFSQIPGAEKFFVFPYESCYLQPKHIKDLTSIQSCTDININVKNIPQVILPYQNYDLYGFFRYYKNKYNQFNFPVTQWILLMDNLFLGVREMIRHQLIHQDIYMSNIMYNQKEKLLKFIDFGLSVSFQNVFTFQNKRLTYIYHCYPPEYMFAYFLKNNVKKNLQFNDVVNTWKNEYICKDPSIGSVDCYHYYNEYISEPIVERSLKRMYDDYLLNPDTWLQRISKNTVLIDLYALGMLCIDLHVHLDFSVLSPKLQMEYKQLILMLMHPDDHQRSGFDKAYAHYTFLKKQIIQKRSF